MESHILVFVGGRGTHNGTRVEASRFAFPLPQSKRAAAHSRGSPSSPQRDTYCQRPVPWSAAVASPPFPCQTFLISGVASLTVAERHLHAPARFLLLPSLDCEAELCLVGSAALEPPLYVLRGLSASIKLGQRPPLFKFSSSSSVQNQNGGGSTRLGDSCLPSLSLRHGSKEMPSPASPISDYTALTNDTIFIDHARKILPKNQQR